MNKKIQNTCILLIALVLLNVLNQSFYKRFDLKNTKHLYTIDSFGTFKRFKPIILQTF